MTLNDPMNILRRRMAFAAEAEGGTADVEADAASEPGENTGTEPDKAAARPWHEALELSNEERAWITKRGLAVDDPVEAFAKALKGHRAAEERLGRPADQLIPKPEEGQSWGEWARAQAEALGLPDSPEGYKIEKPELPDGIEWDSGLEDRMRQIAHEEGVPPAALQKMAAAFAERTAESVTSVETELQDLRAQMMRELEQDWGQQTDAKVQAARQAMAAVMEQAGLDQAARQSVIGQLKAGTGDAGVMRLFAAIGEMMGEDRLEGAGKGASDLSMTPAEARQKLSSLTAREGEYGRAYAAGDRRRMAELEPERQRLMRLAAAG